MKHCMNHLFWKGQASPSIKGGIEEIMQQVRTAYQLRERTLFTP